MAKRHAPPPLAHVENWTLPDLSGNAFLSTTVLGKLVIVCFPFKRESNQGQGYIEEITQLQKSLQKKVKKFILFSFLQNETTWFLLEILLYNLVTGNRNMILQASEEEILTFAKNDVHLPEPTIDYLKNKILLLDQTADLRGIFRIQAVVLA